jgi:hypothetical protein
MAFSPEQERLLGSILDEWNRSEEDIKIAEQVCNKIVIPSIKELRYAGRRIVDALTKMIAGGDQKEITALLEDARFDCHRARHDAIDAASSKIALDLETMIRKLKHQAIIPVFPAFPKLLRDLRLLRKRITESRKNRENREKIYSVLEAVDFPAFVDSFNEMRESEPIMRQLASGRRWDRVFTVGALIIAIIAVIVAIYFGLKNP